MSISDIPSFCLYLDRLLEYQEEYPTFDLANTFLLEAINAYQFQTPPKTIEDFRYLVIREGKSKGTDVQKIFFKNMDRLLNEKRYHRRQLLKEAKLQQQPTFSTNIKTIFLPKLKSSYSPLGYWVADNKTILQGWEKYLQTYELADQRHKRYPTMLVDEQQLQLDIKPTESIIIRDSNTKEVVGVVIRDCSRNKELVEWAGEVVLKSTKYTKSIRVSKFSMNNFYTNKIILDG